MKKMINKATICGKVFKHNLTKKTVQRKDSKVYGQEFIMGDVEIAVSDDGLNVIPVHYSFVTPTTAKGGANYTYQALDRILTENKTIEEVGADEAFIVQADTSIELNDFVNRDGQIVSAKRLGGGFISIKTQLPEEEKRNTFETDFLITKATRVEADPEKGTEEYLRVGGAIFNFRNALLPVEFIIRDVDGMDYFESLEPSGRNPFFTKVYGKVTNETVVKKIEEESAWGAPVVKTTTFNRREWLVTKAAKMPYDFGDEGVVTEEEIVKAQQDREVYLADVKRRDDEYKASKEGTAWDTKPATVPVSSNTEFKF